MNQSQFLAITCNSLEAREKSHVRGAIGFGFVFDSHWLKNWRESFKPIAKPSNRNHVITFDSHLKTALLCNSFFVWGTCLYVSEKGCCYFNESAKTRASSNTLLIIRNTDVSLAELKAEVHKQSTSAPRFLGCNFKLLPPVL